MAEKVRLHEAMVVCMIRQRKFSMSTIELAKLNEGLDLYRRPEDGKYPEPGQLFRRATKEEYRWMFEVEGNSDEATVSLRNLSQSVATL
jgi:hypothetical protein